MERLTRKRSARGFTLIEVLAATAVFMVGVLGLMGAFSVARRSTSIAGRQVWAGRIGHDLVSQVALWDYNDPRLAVKSREDSADRARKLESSTTATETLADYDAKCHAESALACGGTCTFGGIPTADLSGPFGSGGSLTYQRYWCVQAQKEDGDTATVGTDDARKLVTAVVYYQDGGKPRRYVTYHVRYNPRFRTR